MLRLRLLGTFGLSDASGATKPLPPHRLALLAILAAAGEVGIARDKVLAYLWPESTTAKARASLEQMLHALRSSLDAPTAFRGNPLRLEAETMTSDVGDFRATLSEGDLERAVELYGGPFLDGFYLSDLPEFEEWLESERAALAERYATALERLAADAISRGDHMRAVQIFRSLGAVSPLNGRVVHKLMEALVAIGDRDGALQEAAHYSVRVREQLNAEPEPNVTSFAARLRTEARSVPPPPTAGLVERALSTHSPRVVPDTRALARAQTGQRRRASRNSLIVLGAAALVLLAAASWFMIRTPSLNPKRVLVGSFEDRTGDPTFAPFVRHAPADIVSGLASTGIVEPFDAAVVGGAQAPGDYPSIRRLARRIRAGSVVSGVALRRGDSIEFQIKLTDVRTGHLLRPIKSVVWLESEPRQAIALLTQRVMAGYAANADLSLRHYAVVSQPATYDAYREYQAGVKLRWETQWFDPPRTAAILERFRRAVDLDPTFMAPRIWIATVFGIVGECSRSDSAASSLRAASSQLLPADQADIDFVTASCHQDARGAYDAAKSMLAYRPEMAEHVWVVSFAALGFNKPSEVLKCMERLAMTIDSSPSWRSDCWNLMTHAYHQLGRYREALDMIERVRLEAPDDPLLGKHPLLERYQLRQWAALGNLQRVNALIDARIARSSQEVPAGGDMLWIGEELRGHGHVAAGRALCQRGVRWFAALPSAKQADVDARATVARLLYCAERWDDARAAYERLVKDDSIRSGVLALSGQLSGNVDLRTRLGMVAAMQGDTAEANRIDRWLAARDSFPRAAYGRSALAGVRHDGERSLGYFRFAWERGSPGFGEVHTDPILEPVRDYPPIHALIYSVK